jgi:hypothetical protein
MIFVSPAGRAYSPRSQGREFRGQVRLPSTHPGSSDPGSAPSITWGHSILKFTVALGHSACRRKARKGARDQTLTQPFGNVGSCPLCLRLGRGALTQPTSEFEPLAATCAACRRFGLKGATFNRPGSNPQSAQPIAAPAATPVARWRQPSAFRHTPSHPERDAPSSRASRR